MKTHVRWSISLTHWYWDAGDTCMVWRWWHLYGM